MIRVALAAFHRALPLKSVLCSAMGHMERPSWFTTTVVTPSVTMFVARRPGSDGRSYEARSRDSKLGSPRLPSRPLEDKVSEMSSDAPTRVSHFEGLPVLDVLEEIWSSATPATINGDLERARRLVDVAPDDVAEQAELWVARLERLKDWLHDR